MSKDADLVLYILVRAVTAFAGLAKNKLGREARKWTPTLNLLTNSNTFSTFTPNKLFNNADITKAQYVTLGADPHLPSGYIENTLRTIK